MQKAKLLKVAVVLFLLLGFGLGWVGHQLLAQSNSQEIFIGSGSFTSEPSYTIFLQDGVVKARNDTTGEIQFSNSDFATVVQQVADLLVNGGTIFIRRGLYTVTKTINITNQAVYIKGEGTGYDVYGTVLKLAAGLTNTAVFRYNPTSHKFFGGISDLTIDGSDNSGSIGIHLQKYISDIWIQRVWIKNCAGAGIKIEGAADPSGVSKIWNIWILDCLVESCGYGIWLTNADSQDHQIDRITIRGGHFYDNINSIRIDAEWSFRILIDGISVEKDRQHSIYISAGRRVQIVNCRLFDIGTDAANTYDGIYITNAYANPPIDILIQGNSIGNHWVKNQMRYCITLNYSGTYDPPSHIRIFNNILDTWKDIEPLQPIYINPDINDVVVRQNQGYLTESWGIANITGTGSATVFEVTVQHHLVCDNVSVSVSSTRATSSPPSYLYAYLNDSDSDGFKETIVITVKFDSAPANGEVVYIYWEAKVVWPENP